MSEYKSQGQHLTRDLQILRGSGAMLAGLYLDAERDVDAVLRLIIQHGALAAQRAEYLLTARQKHRQPQKGGGS